MSNLKQTAPTKCERQIAISIADGPQQTDRKMFYQGTYRQGRGCCTWLVWAARSETGCSTLSPPGGHPIGKPETRWPCCQCTNHCHRGDGVGLTEYRSWERELIGH